MKCIRKTLKLNVDFLETERKEELYDLFTSAAFFLDVFRNSGYNH
jgi:hypothetical protein